VVRHALRATVPILPAAALVVGVRALGEVERSAALALGELTACVAVTAAATIWLERGQLAELGAYLRGAPSAGRPSPLRPRRIPLRRDRFPVDALVFTEPTQTAAMDDQQASISRPLLP
jgi:hypothetical protein